MHTAACSARLVAFIVYSPGGAACIIAPALSLERSSLACVVAKMLTSKITSTAIFIERATIDLSRCKGNAL